MAGEDLIIREANADDIQPLASLMTELGYPTSVEDMRTRFNNIQGHKDYMTLIALKNNGVVGMVGLSKHYAYEKNGYYARVVSLVTTLNSRQIGIGKKLMEAAENWARQQGAEKILLNCGNREERETAHSFYKALGYEIRSSGYVKKL